MRRLAEGVLATALLIPVAALGQVTQVTTSQTVTTTPSNSNVPSSVFPTGDVGNGAWQLGELRTNSFGTLNNYQVSSSVTASEIIFADNTTSEGYGATTTAQTKLVVNYTNGGSKPVTPSLQSTILPGGFGFYVDQPVDADVNQSPQAASATFASFNGYASPAAAASFTFDIYSGLNAGPSTLVASYTDSLSLAPDVGSGVVTAGPAPALNGFRLITPANSDAAVAYQWNATTVNVPASKMGVTLNPCVAGGSCDTGVLTYVITVSTTAFGEIQCGTDNCPSILAYSGFGDPISKNSGVKGVADPYFARLELGLPTFNSATGALDETLLPQSLPELPIAGALATPFQPVPNSVLGVPEPEAWLLMLAGLGLTGAVLRRRSRRAAAVEAATGAAVRFA